MYFLIIVLKLAEQYIVLVMNLITSAFSILVKNQAAFSKCRIQVCTKTKWKSNSTQASTFGGAIAVLDTILVINGSRFINNTSEVGEGGASYTEQKSVTNIHYSKFYGNHAKTLWWYISHSKVLCIYL